VPTARLQLDAARRYHRKLRPLPATDEGYDLLRAFFENCWHVKDYAKSELSSVVHSAFEAEVASTQILQIVADLANRSKHVILTKTDRVGAAVTVIELHVFDGAATLPAIAAYRVTLADGSAFDAFDVADRAIAAWDPILTKYGI
jgi:hypothetical protein